MNLVILKTLEMEELSMISRVRGMLIYASGILTVHYIFMPEDMPLSRAHQTHADCYSDPVRSLQVYY